MKTSPEQTSIRNAQANVLVVDDDPWVQRLLGDALNSAQYAVTTVQSGAECLKLAGHEDYDVILLDVILPDVSGIETLRRLKAADVGASIVMISGQEEAAGVVEAMRLGAIDYLVKPLIPDKVFATVSLAARAGRLERENRRLRDELGQRGSTGELIGRSPVLRRLIGSVARVAESDATVLIEGRPGTGKSAVAEMIHRTGRRMAHPMVELAADTATVESLEQHLHDADHGILLIEDVEQLAPAVQSRLVRYLKEERGHKPAGIGPDARIVATTSTRLPEAVARGRFREDLYYRLNVFPVQVPSLQERRDDIALLATHFLTEAAAAGGTPHAGFSATAMILLETHPWPGNVAQLRSVIQRAHLLAAGAPIDRVHLMGPATGLEVQPTPEVLPTTSPADDDRVREADILPLEIEERRLLARALKATAGNVRRAAELLKIGRATLYRKIQVYDLKLR